MTGFWLLAMRWVFAIEKACARPKPRVWPRYVRREEKAGRRWERDTNKGVETQGLDGRGYTTGKNSDQGELASEEADSVLQLRALFLRKVGRLELKSHTQNTHGMSGVAYGDMGPTQTEKRRPWKSCEGRAMWAGRSNGNMSGLITTRCCEQRGKSSTKK